MPEYKGKERRDLKYPTRRKPSYPAIKGGAFHTTVPAAHRRTGHEDYERRGRDRMSARTRRLKVPTGEADLYQMDTHTPVDVRSGEHSQTRGLVEMKPKTVRPERRIGGAGRRKGDMPRALRTGEPVYFDATKSPKSAFGGKLAKKAAKKLGPLGVALGTIGIAKEAKATIGEARTSGIYSGSRTILPKKPKVK